MVVGTGTRLQRIVDECTRPGSQVPQRERAKFRFVNHEGHSIAVELNAGMKYPELLIGLVAEGTEIGRLLRELKLSWRSQIGLDSDYQMVKLFALGEVLGLWYMVNGNTFRHFPQEVREVYMRDWNTLVVPREPRYAPTTPSPPDPVSIIPETPLPNPGQLSRRKFPLSPETAFAIVMTIIAAASVVLFPEQAQAVLGQLLGSAFAGG